MTPNRKKIAWSVAAVAALVVMPVAAFASQPFSDVPDGAFYAEPVQWAADNGITTGKTPTSFAPTDPVTRGETVTFLARMEANVLAPRDADQQTEIDALTSRLEALEAEIAGLNAEVAGLEADAAAAPRVYFARVAADGTVEQTTPDPIEVTQVNGVTFRARLPEPALNCTVHTSLYVSTLAATPASTEAALFNGDDGNTFGVHVVPNDDDEVWVTTGLAGRPFSMTAYCS